MFEKFPDFTVSARQNYVEWSRRMLANAPHRIDQKMNDNQLLEMIASFLLHPWVIQDYIHRDKDAVQVRNNMERTWVEFLLRDYIDAILLVSNAAGWDDRLNLRYLFVRTKKIVDHALSMADPDWEHEKSSQYGFTGLDCEGMGMLEEYDYVHRSLPDEAVVAFVNQCNGTSGAEQVPYWAPEWRILVIHKLLEDYRLYRGEESNLNTQEGHITEYVQKRVQELIG